MWRRLLGPLCAYPRVQLFFEKIKIQKLFEDTTETKKYGKLPEGMVRGATFCISPYYIHFDIYEDEKGEGKVYIIDGLKADAEKAIAEWYNLKESCKYKNQDTCNCLAGQFRFCSRRSCPKLKEKTIEVNNDG
jgi:hypothetical protein